MTNEIKSFVHKFLFPIIRDKVIEQLGVHKASFNVTHGIDAQGEDCINISDGHKFMALPIKTPEMENVSGQIDVAALKRYFQGNQKEYVEITES